MRIFRRVWNNIRHGRLDDELRQELETHLALIEEEERAAGLTASEARREARLRFGNPRAHRERTIDGLVSRHLEQAAGDLRQAIRMVWKNPGFALTAIVSLALGIGVNTAMFSVIDAVLVRPLPYAQPSRLVLLGQKASGPALTFPEYRVVRDQARAFASVGAYRGTGQHRLDWAAGEDWIETVAVSAGFLRTLGASPVLGRSFDGTETRAGGASVVILSDDLWRRHFGADAGIVGRAIRIDGTPATVVGVLPAGFWLPEQVDALVPLRPAGDLTDAGMNTSVVARLREGVSVEQAQAAVSGLTERLRTADGVRSGYAGLVVQPLHAAFVGDVRTHLLLLFGATGLLLLLACVNLAMLLMTRFAARGKEIAVRVALGSGRRRLFAQFLVENLVLAFLGAAASIAAAYALVGGLVRWIPFNLPAATPIRVDGGVLLFALGVAVATALVLTFVPLVAARRLNVQHALRSTSRTAGQQGIRGRTRNVLVVSEVALSTILLIGAGLLIHSLYHLWQERLGFDPHGLTTFVTPLDRHPAGPNRAAFIREVTGRLERIPGVRAVALANVLPLAGWSNVPTERAGHPEQSIGGMEIRVVSPNYFELLGIALRRGRRFGAADASGAPPVAIVNETLAGTWWPSGGAVGDRVLIGMYKGRRFADLAPRDIVGIVADAKDRRLTVGPSPTVFVPLGQSDALDSSLTWILKGERLSRVAANVRAAVGGVDPAQRILQLRTLDDVVSAATATPRFDALLFGVLAAVGIALAAVGLYGVLSFAVARRRQEIGTRVALGADRGQVFRMFLRQGVALTGVGLAVGLGGSLILTRWIAALLYDVQTSDLTSFAAVAALFIVVGGAASSLPARRAARLDPMQALRSE
ncbi:MAG TPA: ABC transporter permease [Vicinamibacterales bacterium]|nr:ABC transporter permease [Vicinamibacterales bacterium]